MIIANTRNLIQAISIEGSVAERYFAVTSEVPRNTVDARISAIPRNGRSARAGAPCLAGLFPGNGNGVVSSLAAAAGGGVTAELKAENRIGRALEKRQSPDRDKAGKQKADMRKSRVFA